MEKKRRSSRNAKPLDGFKIVDLTTVVFGPYASQLLGDYGAEVIKIEAPGGDSTRRIGPSAESGMASLFLGVNKNKKSIGIDLRKEQGRDALLRIVKGADVFMHNMRPAKVERLGLAPSVVRDRYPKLIYAELLGFSESGPYAGHPAYDDIIQGLSGLAGLMERHLGEPRYLPTAIADKVAGLFAVQAILAAAFERNKTGRGCTVTVPMFEAIVSFGLVEHLYGAQFAPPLGKIGYPRALMPWRRPYRASDDRFVCIMPYSDGNWRALLTALGDTQTLEDARFADLESRTQNIDVLYRILGGHVATRTSDEWLSLCRKLDVPAHRMNRVEDLEHDPHLKAVEHFKTLRDERMGQLVVPSNPIAFDGRPLGISVPPRLGADSRSVLSQSGFLPNEIDALVASGVIEVAS